MEPKQLPVEAVPIFREGIQLTLLKWSALQMAVENEWGGRNSRLRADQLVSEIFSWFTQSKEILYIDDLENILDEAMISLNTMAEDGSIEEVAEKLMFMHEECLERNYASIEKLREASNKRVIHVKQVTNDVDGSDSDSDGMEYDDSSDMMVDAQRSQSNLIPTNMSSNVASQKPAVEAEDGWTVVQSRKGKGRKT